VGAAFWGLNRLEPEAHLSVDLPQGIGIVAISIVIALASALAVAWHPTAARPLEVLREE
jgi:hypothetical protein